MQTVLPARSTLSRVRAELRSRFGDDSDARPIGQWNVAREALGADSLTPEQNQERERLLSIGYLGGTRPGSGNTGVTVRDTALAATNLRYYTSGHAPRAELIDAEGRVLHHWQYGYQRCRREGTERGLDFAADKQGIAECWRRAALLPDGHLLALFEGHGLVHLDARSELVWGYPGRCHHDLEVAADGSIWVLTRQAGVVPRIHPEKPVLLDFITHLSADGRELESIDLLRAFENSRYASLLDFAHEAGDIFHTNTLELLDGKAADRSPVFAAGNFLISVRELNVVAIVDPRAEQVVWAMTGMWIAQHQPTLLDNGNILVFDNQGQGGRSKVLEFDPLTQEEIWTYANGEQGLLDSQTCGSCLRLPGGNTFITESDNGRALEVTPAGRIVWEFRNPRRTGANDELIASILEMVPVPADYDDGWLTESP